MGNAAQLPSEFDFLLRVQRCYQGLVAFSRPDPSAEGGHSLGGRLLYAAGLDGEGRALVVAANIAGAASLAATADREAQRAAIRDGVADFLVNSLDEALRILKNEVRKQATVAVCVGLAPEEVEREMRERGVVPDLCRAASEGSETCGSVPAAAEPPAAEPAEALLAWSVASAPAHWLPKLDAIALDCLAPAEWPARRWLRLAPRYLGRLAQDKRLAACKREAAARFIERVREQAELAQIGAEVEIHLSAHGRCDRCRFAPRTS